MNTIANSQVFFIISSIGFVILGAILAILLIYIIRTVRTFNRLLEQLEKDAGKVGESAKDLIEDVRESTVFRFLFAKSRKRLKNSKTK